MKTIRITCDSKTENKGKPCSEDPCDKNKRKCCADCELFASCVEEGYGCSVIDRLMSGTDWLLHKVDRLKIEVKNES